MSTDPLTGDTPPEPEAAAAVPAPDAHAGEDTVEAPGADDAGAVGGEPSGASATAAQPGETGRAGAAGESGTADESSTADGRSAGDAPASADAGGPAGESIPADEAASAGEAGEPGATAPDARPAGDTAKTAGTGDAPADTSPVRPKASGPSAATATAAQLAEAVRAVERGERSAASFFAEAPRAARPAATKPPAGKPEGTPAERTRPAPEAAAPHPAARPTAPATPRPPAPRSAPPAPTAPGIEGVRQILTAGGAPAALAEKTAEVLGERAAETLRADPWQLLSVPGVRPDQADGFARALLGSACGPDDERRAQALVLWLLEQAAVAGHSALEASALRAALAQRAVPDPDAALQTAIAEGAVLVFQDALDTPGQSRPAPAEDEEDDRPVRILLGLDRFAMAEESVADGLARLLNTFEPPADVPSDVRGPATETDEAEGEDQDQESPSENGAPAKGPLKAPDEAGEETGPGPARPSVADWARVATAAPSPSAAELIQATALNGLVAHTGAEAARAEPAALIAAARSLGLRAYGATHTENGRDRLAAHLADLLVPPAAPEAAAGDLTAAAVTVSGLLSGQEGPGRDTDGALALDLLVVLDAPQLDLETGAMLIESLTDGTRLILSGDPGVLWSTGPGRLFADLLAARFCDQVASRTPDFGPIGELVSGIGIGELNQVEAPGKEVVIVPVRDAGEAVHRTVQLVAESVPRAFGIPADQAQVITVGHGGAAGTRVLNAALKERLNPGPGRFGGFDPGDRVAYTPTPGRTLPGTVTGADATGLHLDCAGTAVAVPREEVEAGALRHGWALTAHQAAGRRWPAAVVVLPGDAAAGLTRSWVYTAFSRGERHLSIIQGADQALPHAVTDIPAKERTTRLRTLLQLQLTASETSPTPIHPK
ncbi:helix-hairpin-helix domain-containing protein [Streptomyces chattanoogensis]|uniref:helix-hairpin-helix domain-containing protein n=1 Tax=Streptomyces chattanoogensis TaxID=66876 RepID=UPI00369361BC